jgi:hypothetical protein
MMATATRESTDDAHSTAGPAEPLAADEPVFDLCGSTAYSAGFRRRQTWCDIADTMYRAPLPGGRGTLPPSG